MKAALKKSRAHLENVEETYCEHMFRAFGYGFKMIGGGFAAILHAICPAVFETTASRTVARLHEEMQARLSETKTRPDDTRKSS